MKKLSLARRRVVVMASALCCVAAASPMLERELAGALHVPLAWIVIPGVGLEIVAFGFVATALARLKADEAREAVKKGSGEA
jgi:hypothetical protein